jgi:protein Mpv17
MVGSYLVKKTSWTNITVRALLPTPPLPITATLYTLPTASSPLDIVQSAGIPLASVFVSVCAPLNEFQRKAFLGMAHSTTSRSCDLISLWRCYLKRIETTPICTKAVTSCVLNLLGDAVAQRVTKVSRQDLKRTLRFGLFGLFITGPLLHFWYYFLDRIFQNKRSIGALILRLLLDQLLFSPLFYVVYYAYMCALEGNLKYLKFKIFRNLGPTISAQLKIWPAAQIINFRFVPAELQVLFSNIVAFVWNVYFSYINNNNKI